MTGSNTGTPSPAAASGGGGSNNNQRNNNQRNNNNNNNGNSTQSNNRNRCSSSTIQQRIKDDKPIFYLPNEPNKINCDFDLALVELGNYVTMQLGQKHSAHFGTAVKNMKETTPQQPPKPTRPTLDPNATVEEKADANLFFSAEVDIWKSDITAYKKRVSGMDDDRQKVYTRVETLMSDRVTFEVQGDGDYATLAGNPIELLKLIRKACCGFSVDKGFEPFTNIQQQHQLLTDFQKKNENVEDYMRTRTSNYNAFKDSGGSLFFQPGLLKAKINEMFPGHLPTNPSGTPELKTIFEGLTQDQSKQVIDLVEEEGLASLLFFNLNNTQYGKLKTNVQNSYMLGVEDAFPTSKARVVDLCTRFKSSNSNTNTRDRRGGGGGGGTNNNGGNGGGGGSNSNGGHGSDGLQFAQVSETPAVIEPPATGGPTTEVTSGTTTEVCIHCEERGHLATACPHLTPERRAQLLAQNKSHSSRDLGIILDTCSEFTTAPAAVLTNVRDAPAALEFSTSTGPGTRTQIGDLHPFGTDSAITAWVTPPTSTASPTINATILALKDVIKDHRVTYDSEANGGAFLVHTTSGVHYLRPCEDTGFPRLDGAPRPTSTQLLQAESSQATVPTIQANYDNFTEHDIKRATFARNTQAMIGCPSEKEFRHLVSNKLLPNCDITLRDITNARLIFGRDLPSLRGKTRRRKPKRVEVNLVEIPRDFMNLYKNITLTADVFFVNGIPFFLTLSRQVRFLTVQHVPHRSAGELANSLKLTLLKYGAAGFLVQVILMDGEFEKVRDKMPNVTINTTAAREHVGEVERMICTLKGRVRGIRNTFPRRLRSSPIPNLFWKSIVYNSVFWLNSFPASPGVGIPTEYSPRELVLRQTVDVKSLCTVLLGTYCEVHHEPEPKDTNNMEPRTTEGIAMGPVGNIQGTQKFYDLRTSRIIKRKAFTIMPMPDSIIDLIIQHGERDKQGNKLNVRNRKNQPFDWDLEDDDEPLVDDNAPEPSSDVAPFPAEIPGIPTTSDDIHLNHSLPAIEERMEVRENNIAAVNDDAETRSIAARENANVGENELLHLGFMPDIVEDVEEEEEGAERGNNDEEEEGVEQEINDEGAPIVPVDMDDNNMGNVDVNAVVVEDVSEEEEEEDNEVEDENNFNEEEHNSNEDEEKEENNAEEPQIRRSQRTRQPLQRPSEEGYQLEQHVTVNDETMEPIELREDEMELFVKLMKQTQDKHAVQDMQNDLKRKVQTMQVSLQRGIKLWGDKAKESALKEMQQMEDYNVMIPKFKHELSREERLRALATLIFLKEKRDGSIKSRTCANGAPQREYIPKEDASSPTVMTDAVILTACIDAWQLRDVATVDLPGAFLHTVTDEKVIVTLRGVLCDLMVQVAPETYRKYVSMDHKGQPILYMQLYKSMYGLLRSSLLFYRKLRKELETFGMEINPYDPCVFNMNVGGNQLTVTLHVDDLKISHVDSFEVTKLVRYLEKIYGKVVVHRGKVHDYLGMDLDFRDEGYLHIGMFKYTNNLIDEFPEELGATANTPASDHLFKVRDEKEAKFLPEEQAVVFHSFTCSLLFLAQRARRDILTAVSFLTTRVKRPDEDDWLKLRRVLRYLKGTRRMKLRLKIDNLDFITWLVDASHGVHPDMRGHTGAGLTLGEGAAIIMCMKQKMNTRSSTETEIVGVHDALPTILWSVHFLRAQGFDVKHTILKQDNQSAILLEMNGRSSSSKRTKHIEQRFFYITDQVEKGLVKIEHEYTDKMWIDVMTKPKQERPFKIDRAKLMGCPIDYNEESI